MATLEEIRSITNSSIEKNYEPEFSQTYLNNFIDKIDISIKHNAKKSKYEYISLIDGNDVHYLSKICQIYKDRGFNVEKSKFSNNSYKLLISWSDNGVNSEIYSVLEKELMEENKKLKQEIENLKKSFQERLDAELAQIYAPPGIGNSTGGIGFKATQNHFQSFNPVDEPTVDKPKKRSFFSFWK